MTLEDRYPTYDSLTATWSKHMSPEKLAFFESMGAPTVMGVREGIYFEDHYTKKRYINCHVNGGVYNLGHGNPRVVAAVRDALGTVDVGNHHFASLYRAELARRLSATTGDRLPRVVFASGGGEAADLAIKASRASTGRQGVVSVTGGYHGHTGISMMTGDPKYRDPFGETPPSYTQIAYDDLAALDKAVGDDTAAVIVESLPATLGMCIPSKGYLAGMRKLCTERGARMICDEIQSGLGRSGTIWSYQQDDVVPDAVLTGKGLSGSVYPIAATLLGEETYAPLHQHPFAHLSTYGGAELGCLAALAVLDIIEEPGFLDRVNALSERFASDLAGLSFKLRRRGMFMGLDFGSTSSALMALGRLWNEGVFAFPSGNDPRVLQFMPPLVISDEETTDLVARVRRALG